MSERDSDRRLLSGTSSDGALHLDEELFLNSDRPWSAFVPPYGGVINIRRPDDYVTRLLKRCIDGDEPVEHREFVWHYVWENCPYLPHWSLPVVFRHDIDFSPVDWNSPTEFTNWFGWHCACAYIWANHLTAHLQPRENVMALLTSGHQHSNPHMEVPAKVVARQAAGLKKLVIGHLRGPRFWSNITLESPLYPPSGLKRMLADYETAIDRKTLIWTDEALTKADYRVLNKIALLQDQTIPKFLIHHAKILNRLGGGLDI